MSLSVASTGHTLSFAIDSTSDEMFSIDPVIPNNRYELILWELKPFGTSKVIAKDSTNTFSAPIWSPDGNKIIFFERVFGNTNGKPFLFDLQSNRLTALTFSGVIAGTKLGWSPDGKSIALGMTTQQGAGLYLYNVDSKNVKLVTSTPQNPANVVRSPDGKMIVFALFKQLPGYLFSEELPLLDVTTARTSIIQEGGLGTLNSYNAVWSPDSKNIAFFTNAENDHFLLKIYNVTTSQSFEQNIPGLYSDRSISITAP